MHVGKIVVCENCHGNGKVTVWNKQKRTYETVTCPACRGKGKIDISTL